MMDDEIIKALEEKIKALKDDYKRLKLLDAPMDCFEESHIDNIRVLSNALDLINHQKEEIERLKDILYDADGVNLVNYWHQQCKIAENGCRNFEEENETLKAEIERLKGEVKIKELIINKLKTGSNAYVSLTSDSLEYFNIKAEAVKEFAEKLKEHKIDIDVSFGYGKEVYTEAVAVIEIDNLVKEMVGENK